MGENDIKDLGFLEKKYTKILLDAQDSPKSVAEISTTCKIPMSSACRRIRELCHHGMLGISTSIYRGRKHRVYKRKRIR